MLDWLANLIRRPRGRTTPTENDGALIDSITMNISTNFAAKPTKLKEDKGNGETKLYLGSTNDALEYERFFAHFDERNTYSFERKNLLEYLEDMREEYLRTDKYKDVGKGYYDDLKRELGNTKSTELSLILTPFYATQKRFYLDTIPKKNPCKSFIMRLVVPLISELEVVKTEGELGNEYMLYLWRSDIPRRRGHTKRGEKVLIHPNHTRYIPIKLKREVDARDRRRCQATWTLDPKLDKSSGETCDSNIDLQYDHITAFSKGGLTTLNNLQLLCRKHNLMKSDKDIQ